MELFKLFGTIAINNADANRSIDETADSAKDAGSEFDNLANKGQQTESKLSKFMSGMGKVAAVGGKAIAAGLAVAGTAVTAVGKAAISSYADYEQLVGGVETLFDESSATVIANAQNAYKTAGMSANEYMETVTSFSASLLQSLGGDTKAAADKADMAITDMSDNANKMGTSIEMIQNAYNGFAKQNYTMLDNLKLGYGGTKEEMQRLLDDASKLSGIEYDISSYSDIVDAIHIVQNEMGITGTTAKEASSTISGSLASAKASWQNLLTGIADGNQNIGQLTGNLFNSLITVADNLIPRISQVLDGIANAVSDLAPKLLGKVSELIDKLLPGVVNGATTLVNAVVDILPSLTGTLINILPSLIDGFGQIINGLITAAPSILTSLVEGIVILLADVLPLLIDGLINLIVTVASNFGQIIQPLIDKLPDIIINVVNALMNNLPALIEGCVQLVVGIVQATPQIILSLIDAIPTVISSIVSGLWNALPVLLNGIVEMVGSIGTSVWNLLTGYWERLGAFFSGIWDGIKNIFKGVGSWFKDIFKSAFDGIKNVFGGVADWFKNIFNKISDVVKAPINFVIKGLNTLISGINKISFDVPDWVPVIGGKKFGFNMKTIALLAKGGVVDEPTPAVFGEDGAEAVVPLEKNTGWIRNVATQIHAFTIETKDKSKDVVPQISDYQQNQQISLMQVMNEKFDRLISMISDYFPEFAENMQHDIVLDDGTMVARLTPKIDRELGKIQRRKERG